MPTIPNTVFSWRYKLSVFSGRSGTIWAPKSPLRLSDRYEARTLASRKLVRRSRRRRRTDHTLALNRREEKIDTIVRQVMAGNRGSGPRWSTREDERKLFVPCAPDLQNDEREGFVAVERPLKTPVYVLWSWVSKAGDAHPPA